MEIICDKCQKKIKLPDNKIPKNKIVYLNCPSCKNRIEVGQKSITQVNHNNAQKIQDSGTLQEISSETFDAVEKSFDFIGEDCKTAIICELDSKIRQTVISALDQMDYKYKVAESARDALKQMRFQAFDMVVINEKFDSRDIASNGVLTFLQHLPMYTRRNMYVVLLSSQFRTMDNMEAFHKSVNLIINFQNFQYFKKILTRGIADNEYFYSLYKAAAKKIIST